MKPSRLQLTVLQEIGREGRDLWSGENLLLDLARAVERDAPHLLRFGGPTIGTYGPGDVLPKETVRLLQGGRAALDGLERLKERQRRRKLSTEAAVTIAFNAERAIRSEWAARVTRMSHPKHVTLPEHDAAIPRMISSIAQWSGRTTDRYFMRFGERLVGEQLQAGMDHHRAGARRVHVCWVDGTIEREVNAAKATVLSGVAEEVLLEIAAREILTPREFSRDLLPRLAHHLVPDLVTLEYLTITGLPNGLGDVLHARLTRKGRLVAERLSRHRGPRSRKSLTLTAMEADLLWAFFGKWNAEEPVVCADEHHGWTLAALMALVNEHKGWFALTEQDGKTYLRLTREGREAAIAADAANHNKGR